jgi:Predicted transcriptional regulator
LANHPNRSRGNPARNPDPEEIRAARLERGQTQAEAAATILSSEAGWRKWEAGDRRMHPALWWLYLRGFDLNQDVSG